MKRTFAIWLGILWLGVMPGFTAAEGLLVRTGDVCTNGVLSIGDRDGAISGLGWVKDRTDAIAALFGRTEAHFSAFSMGMQSGPEMDALMAKAAESFGRWTTGEDAAIYRHPTEGALLLLTRDVTGGIACTYFGWGATEAAEEFLRNARSAGFFTRDPDFAFSRKFASYAFYGGQAPEWPGDLVPLYGDLHLRPMPIDGFPEGVGAFNLRYTSRLRTRAP